MEKFEPKNIKGGFDCLPEVMTVRNSITDVLRRNFESFGYLPLETAQLNYYDLLSYKYENDAEILHEIYKLKDQGDRELGLRFDLTVPFCKVIAMNRNLRMPFKRYEIGKVWRNGPVKLGRTREFYQCDVDCVGISGVYIEAELLALAVKCYLEIGIEPQIKIGNRKLLSEIIADSGVQSQKTEAVVAILDKMSKISKIELYTELYKHITKPQAEKLVSSVGKSAEDLEKEFAGKPSVLDALREYKQLELALLEQGILKYCEFAPYLARGLNIYTGAVWEVYDKAKRIPSALGGGGRYDNIITNFIGSGQQYPAVGISFGLEPIMAVLADTKSQKSCIDLMVIPMGTENHVANFASELRKAGARVLVYLGGKSVGKAFDYANSQNIPYVSVLGETEVTSGEITIKNMRTGTSTTIKQNETKQINDLIHGG
jgi:histidyl-tRNA synthetase